MPIYEYFCPDCRVTFELQRSMADRESRATCPQCTGHQTSRVMSTFTAFGSGRALAGGGCGTCVPTAAGGCATCGVKR
jgi:putative FmdB family regulatory protein